MLGCYDFCGHYEWTFGWLDRLGGDRLVTEYWESLVDPKIQELIAREGFPGMAKYWGHTLAEESPSRGYSITQTKDVFRIDMSDCPSKGFLLRNGLENYRDYCEHCMGWVGPLMEKAGYVVNHEHNHCGQCWWEMRRPGAGHPASAVGETSGDRDVRLLPSWRRPEGKIDRYVESRKVNNPA